MGITNFPNGVSSFGIVLPAGSAGISYFGVNSVGEGRTLFVDGDHGNDAGGLAPDKAFTTIQGAIDAAKKGDRILILPKAGTLATGDPTPYTENLTVDVEGLTLEGCAPEVYAPLMPQIKTAAAGTVVIDITAPGVTIKNLDLNGASCNKGIIKAASSYGVVYNGALNIVNCHIRNGHGATDDSADDYSAINLNGNWNVRILNNHFFDCRGAILLRNNPDSTKDVLIRGNTFLGTASSIDTDIFGDGLAAGLCIDGNVFGHGIGTSTVTGATKRYIQLSNTNLGIISRNVFACTGLTLGAAGTGVIAPVGAFLVANYAEDGLLARS